MKKMTVKRGDMMIISLWQLYKHEGDGGGGHTLCVCKQQKEFSLSVPIGSNRMKKEREKKVKEMKNIKIETYARSPDSIPSPRHAFLLLTESECLLDRDGQFVI